MYTPIIPAFRREAEAGMPKLQASEGNITRLCVEQKMQKNLRYLEVTINLTE